MYSYVHITKMQKKLIDQLANWSLIEIEVGIFFFRYHDVLLCADHEFLKTRQFVIILAG